MKQKLQRLKGGRLGSQLFLKTFMLLAFMLSGIGSVLAQTVTWTASAPTTVTYKATLTGFTTSEVTGDVIATVTNTDNAYTTVFDEKTFYKFTSDDSHINLKKNNGSFHGGDKLKVTLGTPDDGAVVGFRLKASDTNAAEITLRNAKAVLEYTLKSSDIEDDGSISVYRTGNNQGYRGRYYEFSVESSDLYATKELSSNTDLVSVITGFGNWEYNSGRGGITNYHQGVPTRGDDSGACLIIRPKVDINFSLSTYSSQNNCNLRMYDDSDPTHILKDFRQKGYCTNDFGTLSKGKTYLIYGDPFKATGDLDYVFFKSFTATKVCTNANHSIWVNGTVGTGTDNFNTAFSDFYELESGKQYHFTFHIAGGDKSYKNWYLQAAKTKAHSGDTGWAELLWVRQDRFGFFDGTNVHLFRDNSQTELNAQNADVTLHGDVTFINDMKNADVDMTVTYADNKLFVFAKTTSSTGAVYYLTGSKDADNGGSPIQLFFGVEAAKITNLNAVKRDVYKETVTFGPVSDSSMGSYEIKSEDNIVYPSYTSGTDKITYIAKDEKIKIHATAASGYEFYAIGNNAANPREWSQNDETSHTFYVKFKPNGTYYITIQTSGPDGYADHCSAKFEYEGQQYTEGYVASGATIKLVGVENKGEGYLFNRWADTETISWNSTVDSYEVKNDVTIKAEFVPGYVISATVSPAEAGSVDLYDTNANWHFPSGSRIKSTNLVRLTATANTDYQFVSWSDNVTENPREFRPSQDMNVTANYVYVGKREDVDMVFSPSPIFLYVGGPTKPQPELYGNTPGAPLSVKVGSEATLDADGDGATDYEWTHEAATWNDWAWTPGSKPGITRATVIQEEYGKYNRGEASYDVVVKPGRYSDISEGYTFSQDYGQYDTNSKLANSLSFFKVDPENISWDSKIQIKFNNNDGVLDGNGYRGVTITRGTFDVIAVGGTVIDEVRIIYVNRSSSWEGALTLTTDKNASSETLARTNHQSVKTFTDKPTKLYFSKSGNVAVRAIEIKYHTEGIGFGVTKFTGNLVDVKQTTGMPVAGEGVTYSVEDPSIAHVDPSTGALTYLKLGQTRVFATKDGNTVEYTLVVTARDAQDNVTVTPTAGKPTKYTYTVTGEGKMTAHTVAGITGITMEIGNGSESVIVKRVNSGMGLAVIGTNNDAAPLVPNGSNYSTPGNPDGTPSTTGTYYKFVPSINGTLQISGYTTGTHHSEVYILRNDNKLEWMSQAAGQIDRDKAAITQSKEIEVEAGKVYYLAEINSDGVAGYFSLVSFSFTPKLEFPEGTSYICHKRSEGKIVTGFTSSETLRQPNGFADVANVEWKAQVICDENSNLSLNNTPVDQNNKVYSLGSGSNIANINIVSPDSLSGGSIMVFPCINGTDIPSIHYVITVPYVNGHVWDFSDMANKNSEKNTGKWFLTWEVRLPGKIKDPTVVVQGKTDNDNAALIDQTNGLTIKNYSPNSLGLHVTGFEEGTKWETEEEKKAVLINSVNEVNIVALKDATVTLPDLRKDWFVKIYLDPHTGNTHGSGCGCEFSVTNLKDLYGKVINPDHVIMSYGTQWTESTEVDFKNPKYPFAGCIIFRVQNDGDVTFNFKANGWDKIVKIEVARQYSSELVFGPWYDPTTDRYGRVIGDRVVDYLRWNHSWVHRVSSNGTDEVKEFSYSGSPLIRAENAKYVDHEIAEVDGPGLIVTLTDTGWKSNRGAFYKAADMTATGGVGNVKVLSKANYQAYQYDNSGNWSEVSDTKYALNANETWLAIGKLTEKPYPYTWDFTDYHLSVGQQEGEKVIHTMDELSGKVVDGSNYYKSDKEGRPYVKADTTYGYWVNKSNTNHLAKVDAGRSDGVIRDCPYYYIDDNGDKHYTLKINKPLFANGAQLTYGYKAIPETEGLGFSIDQAYVGYKTGVDRLGREGNYPDYDNIHEYQISWDGQKITANGTAMHITVPNVTAGMFIFVKGSTPTTGSANVTKDLGVTFKENVDGDITIFKVTETGDVVLDFASGSHVSKIGVTDQVKPINAYGYATESRKIDIDHNETKTFSADVDAYFVGYYNRDNSKVTESQVASQYHIPAYTGVMMRAADHGTKKTGYNVPLFVPGCNIAVAARKDVTSDEATTNKLLPTTTATNTTSPCSFPTTEGGYTNYTLTNLVGHVNDAFGDNPQLDTSTIQESTIGFYKWYGTSLNQNMAYLHLETSGLSDTSKVKGFVFFEGTDDDAISTIINTVEVPLNNDAEYYTINGIKLNGAPTKAGVYIKNGKKIYVK